MEDGFDIDAMTDTGSVLEGDSGCRNGMDAVAGEEQELGGTETDGISADETENHTVECDSACGKSVGAFNLNGMDGMFLPSIPSVSLPAPMVDKPPDPNFEVTELPPTEHNGVIPSRVGTRNLYDVLNYNEAHNRVVRTEGDTILFGIGRKEVDIEPYAVDADGVPVYRYLPYFSQVEGEFLAPVQMPHSGWQYVKFPADDNAREEMAKSLRDQWMEEYKSQEAARNTMQFMERMYWQSRQRDVQNELAQLEWDQKIKDDQNYMHELEIAHIRDMTIDQMHKVNEIGGLTPIHTPYGDSPAPFGAQFTKTGTNGAQEYWRVDVNGNAEKFANGTWQRQ